MEVGQHSPHPKTNADINKGTPYSPVALISVIAKTMENILLPYITANIPSPPTQSSTVTEIHTLKHCRNGVQLNGFPCPANHCSTRFEQSFRHNKHTHTNQNAATYQHSRNTHEVNRERHQWMEILQTYRNHTSIQRQFETVVSHVGVLPPTLFNFLHSSLTTIQSTGSGHGLSR